MVAAEVLDPLPRGADLTDPQARHLPGVYILDRGTVYRIERTERRGIPSLAVYNSWNPDNDFSNLVAANAADLAFPVGSNLEERVVE